jgi:tRNA-5-methyluridine54 2-sulfurtransferase
MKCRRCKEIAAVALPSHHTAFCPACFEVYFSRQVERAIHSHKLLAPDDKVLVAVSGGKDSLALIHQLAHLGYRVTALHIDLGIKDSSGPAREIVAGFCEAHGYPLRVVDPAAMGLAIPEVKAVVKRPICSVCGKIKRHFMNKVAYEEGFDALATGHNLDDEVARLFANTLRWDRDYLGAQGPLMPAQGGFARKIKPLFRLSEFETAAYCFLKDLRHGSAPCPYSKGASFTGHKRLWADMEETSPGSKTAFYERFLTTGRPAFAPLSNQERAPLRDCARCGSPSNADVCGVCRVREQVEEAREKGRALLTGPSSRRGG